MRADGYVGQSERLLMRRLTHDDLPRIAAWIADPTLRGGHLATASLGVNELAAVLEVAEDDDSFGMWAFDTHDGRHVGWGCWKPDFPWAGVYECELILSRELKGWGYGIEAGGLLVDHLFRTVGAVKVIARAAVVNRAAVMLFRRLGGREEGRLRRHLQLGDHAVDILIFGLLREEWEQAGAPQHLLPVPAH